MATSGGPNIVIDNTLEIFLDASSNKTVSTINDSNIFKKSHGLSVWVAMLNGTATYAAPFEGTIIYKQSNLFSTPSVVVSKTSSPKRGTFSVSAGDLCFSNKPIHLMDEGEQHILVPISLRGTQFGNYSTRYGSSTYYCYCPFGSGTVYHYKNVNSGINGTATESKSISEKEIITFTNTSDSVYSFFESTVPIVMSCKETTGDYLIMPPASTQVYRRRDGYERTVLNTNPSTIGTYYVSDSNPVIAVEIADGAGGDACQGLGKEFLSQNYTWGSSLSDYHIVAPYSSTTVNVYYYSNNNWNLGVTHYMNGTETSPAVVFREGNSGLNSSGNISLDSGGASYLANGANLWKWESNNPILITINDTSDDEDILLGWSNDIDEGGSVIEEVSNKSKLTLPMAKRKSVNNKPNIKSFDLENRNNLIYTNFGNGRNVSSNPFTVIAWVKSNNTSSSQMWVDVFGNGSNQRFYSTLINGNVKNFGIQSSGWVNSTPNDTDWHHQTIVMDGSTARGYDNGIQIQSQSYTSYTLPANLVFGGRQNYLWDGEIALIKIYSKALSNKEILQNFNATRGRFGI